MGAAGETMETVGDEAAATDGSGSGGGRTAFDLDLYQG